LTAGTRYTSPTTRTTAWHL